MTRKEVPYLGPFTFWSNTWRDKLNHDTFHVELWVELFLADDVLKMLGRKKDQKGRQKVLDVIQSTVPRTWDTDSSSWVGGKTKTRSGCTGWLNSWQNQFMSWLICDSEGRTTNQWTTASYLARLPWPKLGDSWYRGITRSLSVRTLWYEGDHGMFHITYSTKRGLRLILLLLFRIPRQSQTVLFLALWWTLLS